MRGTMLTLALALLLLSGCAVVTKDQQNWVLDKANRSGAFVRQMEQGKTTRLQEQAWVRSQDASWRLWAERIGYGYAAPSWVADVLADGETP